MLVFLFAYSYLVTGAVVRYFQVGIHCAIRMQVRKPRLSRTSVTAVPILCYEQCPSCFGPHSFARQVDDNDATVSYL